MAMETVAKEFNHYRSELIARKQLCMDAVNEILSIHATLAWLNLIELLSVLLQVENLSEGLGKKTKDILVWNYMSPERAALFVC